RLIYVSVSGFGDAMDSPYREQPAYGPVVEAMGGLFSITAEAATSAPRVGTMPFVGDLFTAQYAAVGALAALHRRDVTGEGSHVDVSLFDSVLAVNEAYFTAESMGAPAGLSTGKGTGLFNTFAAKDGYFLVAAPRPHQYHPVGDLVGHPEWRDDPRLLERRDWELRCDDLLRPAIEAWARDKTRDEAVGLLAAAGVPAGPLKTIDDLRTDAHVAAHEMFVRIPTQDGGHVLVMGTPIKFDGQNRPTDTAIPAIGEHTADVLAAYVDLSPEAIRDLQDAGVISTRSIG
ncbi:MAG: CoA transferase, partial [Mycetocola sp.]